MQPDKTIDNFGTILNRKLDHSAVNMLGRNGALVFNTVTKDYIFLDPTTEIDSGLKCTTVPTCVTHKQFEKIVRAIHWHYGAKIHDMLSFDGVDRKSPTDFVDSKGWHSLSKNGK